MKKENLLDSNRYRHFIRERDQALEQILQNTQVDLSRLLFQSLEEIQGAIASSLLKSKDDFLSQTQSLKDIEDKTLLIFSKVLFPMVHRVQRMRRAVYTLTFLSELEAIGQTTQIKPKFIDRFQFKSDLYDRSLKNTRWGDQLQDRIWCDLMNLRAIILNSLRLGMSKHLSAKDMFLFVQYSFPKIVNARRATRKLKALRESQSEDIPKKDFIDTDFIDEGQWQFTLDQYKKTELPPSRFDNENKTIDEESGVPMYNWEFEQELNDDFVNQVRQGQLKASDEMGIKEFVWVAIIDKRTCETCCLPRSGLTTSEIRSKLESGELSSDDCDTVVPPGHFNCRCQLAPVASIDPVEGPDWKSFGEWLES